MRPTEPPSDPETSAGEGGTAWLGAHLFLSLPPGGEPVPIPAAGDRAISAAVAPFVELAREEGWIRRAFFIRYMELGPHVRLRLAGDPAVLEREVRPRLLAALAAEGEPAADEFGVRYDCGSGGVSHLRFLPYEPEVERYGGPAGIEVAEDFFEVSSRAAIDLVRSGGTRDEPGRSARALLAMATLAHVFGGGRERARALAETYGRTGLRLLPGQPDGEGPGTDWERIFELRAGRQPSALAERVEAWGEALEEGEELPEPFGRYASELERICGRLRALCREGRLRGPAGAPLSWPAALDHLAPSYLHMTSNRIGITVVEEAFLGFYLARLLGPAAAGESPAAREAEACSR